jgi:hypothetical protein
MNDDIKKYNRYMRYIATQEISPSQEANRIHTDETKTVFDAFAKHTNLLYIKASPTTTDSQYIQNYVIVTLLGGIFNSPRRSLDFCNYKPRNIETTMNYFDKKTLNLL